MSDSWDQATKNEPCPVCEATEGCRRSDGRVRCMNINGHVSGYTKFQEYGGGALYLVKAPPVPQTASPPPAPDDGRRFLDTWFEPDDLLEVRAIHPGDAAPQQWFGKLDAIDGMIEWAERLNSEGYGIYVGANPRIREGGKAEDVVLARGVFADLDGVTLDEALRQLGESDLPAATMTVLSGGGVHFWWLFDEPMTDLQLWTRIQKGIIAALDADPCIHDTPRIMRLPGFVNTKPQRNGARAELVECIPERTNAVAEFPEAELSHPVAGTPRPPPAGQNGTVDRARLTLKTSEYLAIGDKVPEGQRHGRFIAAVFDLVSCGASSDDELIEQAKMKALASGKPEDELDKGIRDAFDKPRTPATPEPKIPAKAPPIPSWRPFPIDVLPKVLQQFAIAMSDSMNIDPAMIAVPSLGVCAGAIGNTRTIRLTPTFVQPSILWTALVIESGKLKTQSLDAAVAPVQSRQIRMDERYAEELANYEIAKKQCDESQKKGKRDTGAPGDSVEPVLPTMPELVVDNTTVEALQQVLADNPRGVIATIDELASQVRGFDQYKGGRGADVGFWLRAYDGGFYKNNRKTGDRRVMIIPRTTVSVVGATQPPVLRDALGEEHKENGWLARILTAHPPSRPRSWAAAKRAKPVMPAGAYDQLIGSLLALQPGHDEDDRETPVEMHLSDESDAIFGEFFEAFDPDVLGIIDPALRWAYSKLLGSAARMALVLHEVKVATGEVADSDEVDADTMRAGIALARWFAHEQERVYRIMREPPEASGRRRLVAWIRKRGGVVRERDLYTYSRQYNTKADAEEALEDLRKHGEGVWEHPKPGQSGGHPSRLFRLFDTATHLTESGRPVCTTLTGAIVTRGSAGADAPGVPENEGPF